jgi:hypothetical protein
MVETSLPWNFATLSVVNRPNVEAIPNAATTSSSPIPTKRATRHRSIDGPDGVSPNRVGRSVTKPVAIVVASRSVQTLFGVRTIASAILSMASLLGRLTSFPASFQGSSPWRANTDSKFRIMPFRSVPTEAKRNSFKPERLKAKVSELGIINPENNIAALSDISCRIALNTTLRERHLCVASGTG